MNTWKKLLIISGMCSLAGVTPAFASTNLETGSSLAGISVALNNYYAGNAQPEKKLASSYNQLEATETKKTVKQRLQQRQSRSNCKGRNKSPDLIRSKNRDKSSGFYRSKGSSCFTDKGSFFCL